MRCWQQLTLGGGGQAVATLIYASQCIDVEELRMLARQFAARFGQWMLLPLGWMPALLPLGCCGVGVVVV